MDEDEFTVAIMEHATRLGYKPPEIQVVEYNWSDKFGVAHTYEVEQWTFLDYRGEPLQIQVSTNYYSLRNLLISIKGRLTSGQNRTGKPLRLSLSRPTKSCEDWLWAFAPGRPEPGEPGHVGKWMMFVAADKIDETWKNVKAAVERGLAPQAKVSTGYLDPGNPYLICVYVFDSRDKDEVMAVRERLRELGFKRKIPYKLDEMTLRGESGSEFSA